VLRVKGESMREAGILDGDYVVVRPQNALANGETGVVLIGDEATVKKVYVKRGSVTLAPANPAMEPLTYGAGEVSIVGKVIGVIRKL
jgi:repressor LexA